LIMNDVCNRLSSKFVLNKKNGFDCGDSNILLVTVAKRYK